MAKWVEICKSLLYLQKNIYKLIPNYNPERLNET